MATSEDDHRVPVDAAAGDPTSEAETEQKQKNPIPDSIDEDVDTDDVRAVPGTGGPDDVGDVDVDPKDLDLPWQP